MMTFHIRAVGAAEAFRIIHGDKCPTLEERILLPGELVYRRVKAIAPSATAGEYDVEVAGPFS